MACSKLTTSHLSRVRNEVLSAAAKWYDIGLELGVTADYLDAIKKANDDPQDCLRELLKRWLSNVDPQPSWEALVAALRNPAVNYPALASEIELKFCGAYIEPTENRQQSVCSPRLPNSNRVPNNELATLSTITTDFELEVFNHLPAAASTPKPRRPVPRPRRSRNPSVDQRGLVQSFNEGTASSFTGQSNKYKKHFGTHHNLVESENEEEVSL